MRILKEDTIALLIDVQERLMPHIFEAEKLEKNLKILVEGLNLLHIPIIVSEQYKKGLGETISSLKELIVNCPHNEKTAFSCCDEPTIQERIELSGRRNIILFGVEAHVCLLQTAIDLKERGFNPIVVVDCISSRTIENKMIAIERYKQEGVTLTSYESILFELCRVAQGDAFKAMSKLVK